MTEVMTDLPLRRGALADLKVIDLATLFAGPSAATVLGDFGADVLKVEHPAKPDGSRTHGASKNGVGLWWKSLGRNKRTMTLDLSSAGGREVLLKIVADADVVVENFRPGTLERWGLDFETLSAVNPRLILVRVTGFGQFGPASRQPAFGTLAEAMSGFAHSTGQKDGPPTLPPLALADNISGIAAALAAMIAVHARTNSGRGQVVDLAIIEPILAMLGSQITGYDQLGIVPQRNGNRSENNAPRNTYLTRDQKWVAVSSSATPIAQRIMRLVGRADLIDEPWFGSGYERAQHADVIDGAVAAWIGEHDLRDVLEQFAAAEAAIAPVYDIAQIYEDPQYRALKTIVAIPDPELGQVRMQNVLFRLSDDPGQIRFAGRPHGADTVEVLHELGYGDSDIERLKNEAAV